MTKTIDWRDIRRSSDAAGEGRTAAVRQAIEDARALADHRQVRGLSQTDLADALAMNQSRVSRIEREEDLYLSTLRRYVEALGGRLELVAVFEDESVTLGV